MDLTEFLLARIAEDERRLDLPDYEVVTNSHGQVSARGDGWVTRGECPVCGAYQFDGTEVVTEEAWWDHAERAHQRTRVLAECEAKRRIVEEHYKVCEAYPGKTIEADPCCATCSAGGEYPSGWPCVTLGFLALPYADHPDYRSEWAP